MNDDTCQRFYVCTAGWCRNQVLKYKKNVCVWRCRYSHSHRIIIICSFSLFNSPASPYQNPPHNNVLTLFVLGIMLDYLLLYMVKDICIISMLYYVYVYAINKENFILHTTYIKVHFIAIKWWQSLCFLLSNLGKLSLLGDEECKILLQK